MLFTLGHRVPFSQQLKLNMFSWFFWGISYTPHSTDKTLTFHTGSILLGESAEGHFLWVGWCSWCFRTPAPVEIYPTEGRFSTCQLEVEHPQNCSMDDVCFDSAILDCEMWNMYWDRKPWLGNTYISLGIQSYCQIMIGVSDHLLSIVFRFHYHSQKVIGSLGY